MIVEGSAGKRELIRSACAGGRMGVEGEVGVVATYLVYRIWQVVGGNR